MSDQVDLQPETDTVLQSEEYDPGVKVCVESVKTPVRVQVLPRKAGATRTRSAVGTTAIKLLPANHFRYSATIMSIGQNMMLAFSQAASQDPSTMMLWPANVPYICTATTEIYVASSSATTSISYATEYWAAGD